MLRLLSALTLLAASGCVRAGDFHCSSDADCVLAGAQGRCEVVAYCSFPDSDCAGGSRFGAQSGAFANACVGGGSGDDAGIDTASDAMTSYAFSDPFDAGASQWTILSGTWVVTAGAFQQTGNAYNTMAVAGASWSNLTVEAKATLNSGNEDLVRVMFRFADANNFAAGFFSKFYDVAGIEQIIGGTRTFTQSPFVPTIGQSYALRIVVTGSSAMLSIDGTLVHTGTLPNGGPTTGKIGLGTSASDVTFDDVYVTLP